MWFPEGLEDTPFNLKFINELFLIFAQKFDLIPKRIFQVGKLK